MNEKNLLYGVIGLILGIIVTWVFASTAVNNQNQGMMRMMGMRNMMGSSSNMMDDGHRFDNEMEEAMHQIGHELEEKTGDEFDRAFMSEMIIHHQGAVDMASLAKQNAKRDEIKKMAEDIIFSQTKEIKQMQ